MPSVNKKQSSRGWSKWLLILGVIAFALLLKVLLHGKNIALFNPKGLIAREQHNLMLFNIAVFLIVAIPVLCILYFTAWKYRDTNVKSTYSPGARPRMTTVALIWLTPLTVFVVLASVMVPATHRLAPQKSLDSSVKPLRIQVISLRWKWLFIYPDQQIATVNFVQIPVNTPVQFELTADETPMSSFWIPNLGGQLYSMTSHVNRLNLMADTAGDYPGSSAEINGAGFAGMRFTTRASSAEEFDAWTQSVRQSPQDLDTATYEELLRPSENNPAAFYADADPNIYAKVVLKYQGPTEGHGH